MNVDMYILKTDYENVFAIGYVNEIKVHGNMFLPKAGIFAEAQARVVSQLIVDDIKKNNNLALSSSSSRFDGKGNCFMETGNQKADYVAADFYNEDGPAASLEMPSKESYRKKIDFERTRISEWFSR